MRHTGTSGTCRCAQIVGSACASRRQTRILRSVSAGLVCFLEQSSEIASMARSASTSRRQTILLDDGEAQVRQRIADGLRWQRRGPSPIILESLTDDGRQFHSAMFVPSLRDVAPANVMFEFIE